jgi:peptide/nickel transport system substrate-binding protein
MTDHATWDGLIERRLTRRAFVGVASAFGASLLLAACGDDDDDDGEAPTATSGGAPATATTSTGGATATTSTGGGATATTSTGGATATTGTSEPTATTAAQPEGKPGGTLTLGYGIQQILNLDPPRVQAGIVAGELVPNLFSSLVQFDESLNTVPDLAESWDISDDGLEYVFHLREGLKFHNGDPLLAGDLVYTFERTKSEELASPHANKLKNISAAEAVDDLTFKLTFSAPFGPFLAVACSRGPGRALTPISKRAVEEIGLEEHNLKPVGCGPFMLLPETMDPGTGFEMVAFEEWYGGRPFLDKIVVQFIPEPASRINSLQAGDIDMLDIVPAQGVEQLMGGDEVEIIQSPGTNFIGLQMNVARPPWDNLDARLAVAKAIDKQEFIDTALFGLGTVGGPIAPAFAWAYVPPDEIEGTPQAFDLDAAKQLAESSGITGAKPVIITPADDDREQQVVRNQLSEIGLDVQLEKLQDAAWEEAWTGGNYDFAINGSIVDADPDDNDFNFFHSTGPWNTGKWISPEADKLLEDSRATADQAKRAELFKQLQQLLHEQAPHAFLYTRPDIVGFQSYVKGYRAIPEMRYLETVWLDK